MFVGCCEDADEGDDVLFLAGNCRVGKKKNTQNCILFDCGCVYLFNIYISFFNFFFFISFFPFFLLETKIK